MQILKDLMFEKSDPRICNWLSQNQNQMWVLFPMTCTSKVWNQFQTWIWITKIFRMIFGLQKIFKIQNGIRKFSKWFQVVDILLWSPRPWSKRLCVPKSPVRHSKWCNRLLIIWSRYFKDFRISFVLQNGFQKFS